MLYQKINHFMLVLLNLAAAQYSTPARSRKKSGELRSDLPTVGHNWKRSWPRINKPRWCYQTNFMKSGLTLPEQIQQTWKPDDVNSTWSNDIPYDDLSSRYPQYVCRLIADCQIRCDMMWQIICSNTIWIPTGLPSAQLQRPRSTRPACGWQHATSKTL